MIQSKTKLLPSNRELAQMCSRAGISDAQEFFPADSGGFNSVYRVSTAAHGIFILKMSPRYGAPVLTHERNMMHTELTAYDLIRSHTSIRVPRVIFSDFSGKCMPCDWFLMEELEGCPLAQMPRDVRQSPDLMRALGEATAQLHAIWRVLRLRAMGSARQLAGCIPGNDAPYHCRCEAARGRNPLCA